MAVGAGEFLHKLEIPKFHNEPALVGVEKPVEYPNRYRRFARALAGATRMMLFPGQHMELPLGRDGKVRPMV